MNANQSAMFDGIQLRRCPKCKKTDGPFLKDKSTLDGLRCYCAPCERKYAERYWQSRKERSWLRHYGISEHAYYELFNEQGGVCAICKKPETKLHKGTLCHLAVDHDHETGAIRGLLCARCNSGLATFGDGLQGLKLAIVYLEQWQDKV